MNRVMELEISIQLRKAIESKEISPDNIVSIISKGTTLVDAVVGVADMTGAEKKQLLIKVISNIAAGNDGIFNTADDVLSESTVNIIRSIVDSTLIDNIIDIIVEVSNSTRRTTNGQKIMMLIRAVSVRLTDILPLACLRTKTSSVVDIAA